MIFQETHCDQVSRTPALDALEFLDALEVLAEAKDLDGLEARVPGRPEFVMINSMEDAEARWPDLRELRLKREAFEARWPFVFRLDAPGGILEVAEFEV